MFLLYSTLLKSNLSVPDSGSAIVYPLFSILFPGDESPGSIFMSLLRIALSYRIFPFYSELLCIQFTECLCNDRACFCFIIR